MNLRAVKWEIGGFLLASLFVRLWWASQVEVLHYDGMFWISAARLLAPGEAGRPDRLILNTHGLSPDFPPFYGQVYPSLIAIFSIFSSDLETVAKAISVAAGTLTAVPVYLLALSAFDRRAARIAAALFVFYPPMVELSGEVLVEPLYTLLFSLSLLVFQVALSREKARLWLSAGAALGIVGLTRQEGAAYFPLFLLASAWMKRTMGAARLAAALLLMTAGFCAAFLPYQAYLHVKWKDRRLDPYFPERIGMDLYYNVRTSGQFVEKLWELAPDEKGFEAAHLEKRFAWGDYLRRNGEKIIRAAPWHLYCEWRSLERFFLFPFLAVAAAAGLWRARRGPPSGRTFAGIAGVALLGLIEYSFFPWWPQEPIDPRYLTYIVPLVLAAAAGGGALLFESFWPGVLKEGRTFSLWGKFTAGVILLTYACWSVPYFPSLFNREEPLEFKKMAEWMKDRLEPDATVMSSHPWEAFYAEKEWVCAPVADLEKTLRFARFKGATHLSVNQRYGEGWASLTPLLDETKRRTGLKFAHAETWKGKKLVLYEIERAPGQ